MEFDNPDIWKEFERNVVSHSAAHHIVAIADLLSEHGYARVSDVARALNITRGSASLTLKALKQKGFVEEDKNRFLRLSPEGERVAQSVIRKSNLLRRFFGDVLNVPDEAVEVDTCKIEHLLGFKTARRLAQFLEFFGSDDPRAKAFAAAWRSLEETCRRDPDACAACQRDCLEEVGGGSGVEGDKPRSPDA
jgi:DtxR family Mn-dependent transcriptional regulator